MTPDELVVMLLERLAKSKVDFNVDNYNTTRAAAERLLRTLGVIPTEPPKQIEMSPAPLHSTPRCQNCNHNHYHRSEEHTSELQSRENLVCRLLLEKKKKKQRPS